MSTKELSKINAPGSYYLQYKWEVKFLYSVLLHLLGIMLFIIFLSNTSIASQNSKYINL